MSFRRSFTRLATPTAASLLLFACSSPGGAPATPPQAHAESSAALDAPNGGLDLTSKELPAFGDPEVEALPPMVPALAGVTTPPPAPRSPQSTSAAVPTYDVMLVWGHMPPAHDGVATDLPASKAQWTGSIGVAAGTLTLQRTIGFEARSDVAVTASEQAVTFDSQTDGYVDGVVLRVTIPAGAPAILRFATGVLTTNVDLARLGDGPGGMVNAADDASGLGWVGFGETTCAHGFVLGRWVKDQPSFGRGFAIVSDAEGAPVGYIRGPWGFSPGRSDAVWFQKVIDLAGNPGGLSSGSYGDGAARGSWAAANEHDVSALTVGKVEGLYSDAADTGDGRGLWIGRWSGACAP